MTCLRKESLVLNGFWQMLHSSLGRVTCLASMCLLISTLLTPDWPQKWQYHLLLIGSFKQLSRMKLSRLSKSGMENTPPGRRFCQCGRQNAVFIILWAILRWVSREYWFLYAWWQMSQSRDFSSAAKCTSFKCLFALSFLLNCAEQRQHCMFPSAIVIKNSSFVAPGNCRN